MARLILDSNLFIEAARDEGVAEELAAFVHRARPRLYLHAVVAQELLAGAVSEQAGRTTRRWLIEPMERVGRLVVPDFEAWRRSGEIVASLIGRKILSPTGVPSSFRNDALLAASCKREGLTLVTRNLRDFDRIARVEPFTYVAPWPVI